MGSVSNEWVVRECGLKGIQKLNVKEVSYVGLGVLRKMIVDRVTKLIYEVSCLPRKGTVRLGMYSSPMASLVLTDSSQFTADSQHLVRGCTSKETNMNTAQVLADKLATLTFSKGLYRVYVLDTQLSTSKARPAVLIYRLLP
uniref:Uncharacterized protein n=1 Tax=Timema poppense TaxID=170557 RepID=A0A7R9CJQ5_TIMPO|nr:unnamed protein product [Timema poppensis]